MPIYNLAYGIQTTPPIPSNEIFYYPFEGDLDDHSGNGYDLTNSGTTFTTLASGKQVLSVEQASASYTGGLDLTGKNLTASFWFADTATRTGYSDWPYFRLMNGNTYIFWSTHAGPSQENKIYAGVQGQNNWNDAPTYNDLARHYVVITFDTSSKQLKEYIDNSLIATTTLSSGVSSTVANITIGGGGYQGQVHFMISEVILEDKIRTATEIQDYYNATREDYRGQPTTSTYIISNIPTSDTNVYVNVAQSGKTIDSVKFSFTANYTGNQAYIQISGNNSNTNRYGLVFGRNTSGTAPAMAIRGRLGGSDTYYRSITDGFNSSGSNTVEYIINRSGSCSVKCNGTTSTYTATGAELTVLQTIMNLSDMNVYGAQNSSVLSNNQVNVEVTYS